MLQAFCLPQNTGYNMYNVQKNGIVLRYSWHSALSWFYKHVYESDIVV